MKKFVTTSFLVLGLILFTSTSQSIENTMDDGSCNEWVSVGASCGPEKDFYLCADHYGGWTEELGDAVSYWNAIKCN